MIGFMHEYYNQFQIARLQCQLFPFNSDLVKLYNLIHFFLRSWASSLLCGNRESGQEYNTSFALFPCLISLTVSIPRCTPLMPDKK